MTVFDTSYYLALLEVQGFKYDEEDRARLLKYFWQLTYTRDCPIIYTTIKAKLVHIHRFLLDITETAIIVDHIDGNRFNTTKINLRPCNNQENCMNQKPRFGRRYKGTMKLPSGNYRARITVEGKHFHLGVFATELEAAVAYNEAAVIYYGQFARLNKVK